MIQLQIVWNGGEFVKLMLGTYDLAMILAGLIFAITGIFLSALGKVVVVGENKTPDPTPDPTAMRFVYDSRRKRIIGSLISVLVILRMFAPQFTNATLLITFSFGLGLFWYLMTDLLISYVAKYFSKILPGFKP